MSIKEYKKRFVETQKRSRASWDEYPQEENVNHSGRHYPNRNKLRKKAERMRKAQAKKKAEQEQVYSCPRCSYETTSEVGLQIHIGRMHKDTMEKTLAKRIEALEKRTSKNETWISLVRGSFNLLLRTLSAGDGCSDITILELEKELTRLKDEVH